MQLIIDTATPFSTNDLEILLALVTGIERGSRTVVVSEPAAPAVKIPLAKTPVRPAEAPAAPAATPVPAEEDETSEEAADESQEDEVEFTLDDAVALATELVGKNKASVVKAALAKVGAKRVSELKGDKIAAFIGELS